MFQLLQPLIRALQPYLVPVCFVAAWVLVALVAWSLWSALRDAIARSRRLHQIPCAGCRFFTDDHRLKCTVHPSLALTEGAINCPDFESAQQPSAPSRALR